MSFTNTQLMKKGLYDKTGDPEKGGTSKLLEKISFNNAAMTAYAYDVDKIELKIGSYYQPQRGGGGGGMMYGGVGAGGAMIMVPMYYGNIGGGWRDDKDFISFFVKGLFNGDGSHIDGPPVRKDVNVEIDKFVDEAELNTDAEDIVKISNNTYLFGYYIKKEKRYFIYKFQE